MSRRAATATLGAHDIDGKVPMRNATNGASVITPAPNGERHVH
jgi:hypothetical protein